MEQKRNVILMDEHEALVDGHQKKTVKRPFHGM